MTRMTDLVSRIRGLYAEVRDEGRNLSESEVDSLTSEWIETIEEIDAKNRTEVVRTIEEFLENGEDWPGETLRREDFVVEHGPMYTLYRGDEAGSFHLFAVRGKDPIGALYNGLFKDLSDIVGARIVANAPASPSIPFKTLSKRAAHDRSRAHTDLLNAVRDDAVTLSLLEQRNDRSRTFDERYEDIMKEVSGLLAPDFEHSFRNVKEFYREHFEPSHVSFAEGLPAWFTQFADRKKGWEMVDRIPIRFYHEDGVYTIRTYDLFTHDEVGLSLSIIEGDAQKGDVGTYWNSIWRSNPHLKKRSSTFRRGRLLKKRWDHRLNAVDVPDGAKIVEDETDQVWYRSGSQIFCVRGDVDEEGFWNELDRITDYLHMAQEEGIRIDGTTLKRNLASTVIDSSSDETLMQLPSSRIAGRPVKREFKNKAYNARHCAYVLPNGTPVEVQFRTHLEHYEAEWGEAHHDDHKTFFHHELEADLEKLDQQDRKRVQRHFEMFERSITGQYQKRLKRGVDELVDALHTFSNETDERMISREELTGKAEEVIMLEGKIRKMQKNTVYISGEGVHYANALVAGIPRAMEEIWRHSLLTKETKHAAKAVYDVLERSLPEDMGTSADWLALTQARIIKDATVKAYHDLPEEGRGVPRWRQIFPFALRDTLRNLGDYLNLTVDSQVSIPYEEIAERVRAELPPPLQEGYGGYGGSRTSLHDFREKVDRAAARGEIERMCDQYNIAPLSGSIKQQLKETFRRVHDETFTR